MLVVLADTTLSGKLFHVFTTLLVKQCCDQGSRCRDRDRDRGSRVRNRGQDWDSSFRDRGQDRGSIPQDRGRGTRQLAYIINNAVFGGGSSPKILGGIAPQLLYHSFSVLRNLKKYELYIGLHLKSIIMVANSVMGKPLRPVETRPERPRAGVGFLGGEQRVP